MTWGLSRAFKINPGNIIILVIFIGTFLLVRKVREYRADEGSKEDGSGRISVILGVIYTVFYLCVAYITVLDGLTNPLFIAAILAVTLAGMFLVFRYTVLFLFGLLSRLSGIKGAKTPERGDGIRIFYVNHIPLLTFLFCLLCYLPYFLYLFPAVMTPDSIVQYEQIIGVSPFSNHHPLVHTLLFGIFYRLGYLITGNPAIAVSFYTAAQLLFMCFTAAFVIATLRKMGVRPIFLSLSALFYAIVPYHAVFAVTIWKDVIFAAVVTIFVCLLIRSEMDTPSVLNMITLVITGTGICLFRSNGWYAFLICLPFLLFRYRRMHRQLLCLAGSLIIAIVIKFPVMHALHVIPPDLTESLSIPLQQIASVIAYKGDIYPEEREELSKVADLSYVPELYEPAFADNIKELVRAGHPEYLEAHKKDFLLLYLKIGARHPMAYFRAYVQQTVGYFFPDEFYPVGDAEGVSGSAYGIRHTPLIGGMKVVKGKEILMKLGDMIPGYSFLFSMGTVFWIFLFTAGRAVVLGNKKQLIFYLPFLALVFTIFLATPVATEFRYVYFLIHALPLYPAIATRKERNE
ncbi:MAG: DUF6020 family protein [Lachnospiraceae bacterium]|nr:DUF6020 family protein [Lachnospiraceae bacterium]